jgi:hypothetical protein
MILQYSLDKSVYTALVLLKYNAVYFIIAEILIFLNERRNKK